MEKSCCINEKEKMSETNTIKLPKNVDMRLLIKTVYDLSKPQGLGFMHYNENDALTDEECDKIIDTFKDDKRLALSLDYLKGRSCKFHVNRIKDSDELEIYDKWYDHNDEQLATLLQKIIPMPERSKNENKR